MMRKKTNGSLSGGVWSSSVRIRVSSRSCEMELRESIGMLQAQLRDETMMRVELDRRTAQDALELGERIKSEAETRELADLKLEERLLVEVKLREDSLIRETRLREEADAEILVQWQKALRDDQLQHEEDRKDFISRLQQVQLDAVQEREDRMKNESLLTASIAQVQRLQKEEEETRVEQGERLGAAIESLQEAVRVLGPQREEILAKCMEALEPIRNMLNKEVVARTTKVEALDEALRELRMALSDEARVREAAVRAVAEAITEEKTQREDALLRERRMAEEETQRALEVGRKAREEEEKRLQERLFDLKSLLNEEKGLRQEALRVERQKTIDGQAKLQQELAGLQAEVTKIGKQLDRACEDAARRTKEVDIKLAELFEKTEVNRADLVAEVQKRETENRNLEQKALEIQGLLSVEIKERTTMGADLRKYLDVEISARDESMSAERRLRESGEFQLAEAWKAAVRDERDMREGEIAQIARDLVALKTQLSEEDRKREDERSQQHLAFQKMRTDIAEIQGERRVDVQSMREAFNQVAEELKAAQRARKDDIDRLDAALATLGARVDANARQASEKAFALEQSLQGVQSELQREVDARSASCNKLDQQLAQEHRFTEAAVAAEAKAREDNDRLLEAAYKQLLSEESRKINIAISSVAAQVKAVADDLAKDRAANADAAREVAKSLASLQNLIAAEEQARMDAAFQLQRSLDLVREEVATETKERRAQGAALAEDVALLQRGLRQRDDRADSLANQLNEEANDLRERLVKEVRLREAAISQLEQALLNLQNAMDGIPARDLVPAAVVKESVALSESVERLRLAEDEIQRMRRQVTQLQGDTVSLDKAVNGLNNGQQQWLRKV